MMNVRRGYNHARNVGMSWWEYRPGEERDRELEEECDDISKEWLDAKGGLEIQFILGRADWDNPGERRFFMARSPRGVEGFLIYHPAYNMDGWYLDMSRRRMDSPNGTMDFLLLESLAAFREEGARRLYMGMIPDLTFPDELERSGPIFRKVVKTLAKQAELFYPVRSETFFKQKYNPVWEDLYLCTGEEMSMGLLHDLLKAFRPEGVLGIMGKKIGL
jgi:phosphatidylglycerol lysyltransferase